MKRSRTVAEIHGFPFGLILAQHISRPAGDFVVLKRVVGNESEYMYMGQVEKLMEKHREQTTPDGFKTYKAVWFVPLEMPDWED